VVLAVFLVVTGVRMLISHTHHRAEAFLQPPELEAAREQLRQRPRDEALKQQIRALDQSLRQRYFEHLDLNHLGAWLLVAGGVLLVVAGRVAVAAWQQPPRPGLAVTPTDEPLRRAVQARWAVTGTTGAVMAGLLAWAVTQERRLPGSAAALRELQASAVAPAEVGPTPAEVLANWPRFLGPTGDNVAPATNAPLAWNGATGEGVVWRTPIPAPGFSSPVVWGERVFLTGGTAASRHVLCYDAARGDLLWDRPLPPAKGLPAELEAPEHTGFAACSPATDGRRVYAIFLTGELAAFDFGGRLVWGKELGFPHNLYGHASSLMTWGGAVIVQFDQGEAEEGKSRLYALEGATGAVRWEQRRAVPSSWTTPMIIEGGGVPQIITLAEPWVISYDAATGAERWRADCLGTDLAPGPVLAGEVLVVVSPGRHLVGLRTDGQGDVTKTHVVWQFDESTPDITTPVTDGNRLYFVTTSGLMYCLDATTGKKIWDKDLELEFNASPLRVGRQLYLTDTKGVTRVVEAGDAFREVARAELGEPVHASPALVNGRFYVRGSQHLFCLGPKAASP
jgi:outer membrane protein assembly factor BamB